MDEFGLPGQESGNRAVAGTEVSDAYFRSQEQEHLANRLPGATGAVVPAESVGHEVEVLLRLAAPLFGEPLERALVGQGGGVLGGRGQRSLKNLVHSAR